MRLETDGMGGRLLLRPEEAGEVIGVSRSQVYKLISEGQIPTVCIGRSRRISRRALEAWVAARESGKNALPADAA